MVKNAIIAALFLAFIAVSIYGLFQRSQVDDRTRAAILAEQEKIEAQEALDSATAHLKLVRDSLELAYVVASNARIDANKALYEGQKLKKQVDSFILTEFKTDRQRDSVLRVLYPSLN